MFEDVYRLTTKLNLSTDEQVDALERQFGNDLPPGYREYMTTLGVGVLSDLLRVYPPDLVAERTPELSNVFSLHFFWEATDEFVSRDDVRDAQFFANTCDGDEVLWLPEREEVVVLPRHETVAWRMPKGFEDPLGFVRLDGSRVIQDGKRYFASYVDRWTRAWWINEEVDYPALVEQVVSHWSADIVARGEHYCIALSAEIGGRVQLTTDPSRRVGLRLTFDKDAIGEVEAWESGLVRFGFKRTEDYPPAEA